MSYTWDWLLLRMIDHGILDYYQMNACSNFNDFVLYKLGRAKGALLTECHIIKRTSARCYRISSFDFDEAYYSSAKSADDVCRYIIQNFIPDYIKPKTAAEKLRALRDERRENKDKLTGDYAAPTLDDVECEEFKGSIISRDIKNWRKFKNE